MTRKLLIIALLTVLPCALFADTVYLKTGKILRGRIISETENYIAMESEDEWKEISREDIRKIIRNNAPAQPPAGASQTTPAASASPLSGKPRDKARALVLSGLYPDAVAAYNPLARGSRDATLAAEYAFALALAGHTDLALAHLDRAFLADAANLDVMFYASAVFEALGMRIVAKELYRPPPAWLAGGAPGIAALKLPVGEYQELFDTANLLISQRRFASAAPRFASLVGTYPDMPLPWAGYAIVLEELGAFKAAAEAVEKNIELGKEEDQETVKLHTAHKAELEARPPATPAPAKKLNEMLKGRYLSFFGLGYNHTETASIFDLQTRVGKFLTNRFDAGASFGLISGYEDSDYNGLSFGVSGRYNNPLPVSMPLNFTTGARLGYQPGPEDNFAVVLTPGLSYVLANGALDLYLDLALTGPSEGTQTLSLGYTVYFGGAGK